MLGAQCQDLSSMISITTQILIVNSSSYNKNIWLLKDTFFVLSKDYFVEILSHDNDMKILRQLSLVNFT